MEDWSLELNTENIITNNNDFTLFDLLELMAEGNKNFSIQDEDGNAIYYLDNKEIKEIVKKDKNIDYALTKVEEVCPNVKGKKEIIKYFCPPDFGLKNMAKCEHYSDMSKNPCEECWNKEVKLRRK